MPLSPAAMGLLALLVASVGYVALRQRSGLMALVLAVVVGAAGLAADVRQALAAALYTVVLSSGSNSATVAVPDGYAGPVDVQNTLGIPVTITSIAVKGTLTLDAASPLKVGGALAANTTWFGAIVLKCPPGEVFDPGSGLCL